MKNKPPRRRKSERQLQDELDLLALPSLETSPPRSSMRRVSSAEAAASALTASIPMSLPTVTEPRRGIPPFVIKATAVASLGGILFGYDMGVMSGALPQLTVAFELTDRQQELVVGILYLGGALGAVFGGALCDTLGRRTSIIVTDGVFLVGAIMLLTAPTLFYLYLGRIVVGFAIAVSGIADVAYLHELSPVQYRGSIVSVNEACISLGFLLAFIAGNIISRIDPVNGWRSMFGLSGLLAFIQLAGIWQMPESPVWLKEKGHPEKAQQALRIIYGSDELIPHAEDGLQEDAPPVGVSERSGSRQHLTPMDSATATYDSLSPSDTATTERRMTRQSSFDYHYRLLHQDVRHAAQIVYRYRKQAYIALFLSVAQQLSAQTVVLNYAPLIFSHFINGDASLSATLWIGLVKFAVTAVVIYKIENMGRRFLLLTGMSVVVVGLLLIAISFSTGTFWQETENETTEDTDDDKSAGMVWALPGVLLVVMGYSGSFGPLTWLLTSELFPTEIRGRALGASTIVTYLGASLVTSTFLSMQAWLGASTVFCVYALLTSLGIVFAYLAIPDTGGKTVAETEDALVCMWWWRRDYATETFGVEDRPVMLETELT